MQTQLHDKVDPFYKHAHVGILKPSASYCWAAFGPAPWERCKQFAHQTIALSSNGLRIFVNIETKPATDRLKAAVSRPEFLKALKKLHKTATFELVLEKSVRDFPRPGSTTPKMRLHSSLLNDDDAWKVFAKTVVETPLPYFCLDRPAVTPPELICLTEGAAIKLVVESCKLNHAVVKMVND